MREEELKKEQISRLAKFMVDEYQYQLFPKFEGRGGIKKMDKHYQLAWIAVAKLIIEDFEF